MKRHGTLWITARLAARRHLGLSLLFGLCPGCLGLAAARVAAAALPTRTTVMVPMRDGIRLATDVYLPAGDGPWPVALARTPYNRLDFRTSNGGHGGIPSSSFLASGIALVVQDTRGARRWWGSGASEGEQMPYVNEGWGEHTDGLDTVNWIRSQPWCNGKIAGYGGSDVGMTQVLLAGAGPEGVVGMYLRSAPGTAYPSCYIDGVWRKDEESFWSLFPPAAQQQFRAHPHYDDFWRGMDLGTRLDRVHWPMVHMTGWYDFWQQGVIDGFSQLQENGGDGARGHQHLVIGPWMHADIWTGRVRRTAGALTFPPNAVLPPDAPTGFEWLSSWLTGQPAVPDSEPEVRYYVMGDVTDPRAPGNVWRSAAIWPPPSQPLRLYFTADGRLDPQSSAAATREYDYDPKKPVPTLGGLVEGNGEKQLGAQDQRPVEGRADVLVFTTPPLAQPMEVTGRIAVHLNAATSAKDTDFTAKLTDVYPDGRSMILADGIVRARFRHSLETEEPINPGQPYAYDIDLWSTSIIFNKGHQIRVAISSSNSPRLEPNTNTGGPLPPDPKEKPVVAHQTIFLGGAEASHIVLPQIIPAGAP